MAEAENEKGVGERNLRNSIVRKISSLLDISGKSGSDQASSQMVICSAHGANANNKDKVPKLRKEKNRESARLARERKKLYVSLLKRRVGQLERRVKAGQCVQMEVDSYLRNLNRLFDEAVHPPYDLDRYFDFLSHAQSSPHSASKIDLILDEFHHLLMASLRTLTAGVTHLTHRSLLDQPKEPCYEPLIDTKLQPRLLFHINNFSSLEYTLKDPTAANKLCLYQTLVKLQHEANSLNGAFAEIKNYNEKVKYLLLANDYNSSFQIDNKGIDCYYDVYSKDSEIQMYKKAMIERSDPPNHTYNKVDLLREALAVYTLNEPSSSLLNTNEIDGVLTRAIAFVATEDFV